MTPAVLDGSEHFRHDLPFVQQDPLGQPSQRGVRVGTEGARLRVAIQPHDGLSVTPCRCRLARGAGTDEQDRRKRLEYLVESPINQTSDVLHGGSLQLPLWTHY